MYKPQTTFVVPKKSYKWTWERSKDLKTFSNLYDTKVHHVTGKKN